EKGAHRDQALHLRAVRQGLSVRLAMVEEVTLIRLQDGFGHLLGAREAPRVAPGDEEFELAAAEVHRALREVFHLECGEILPHPNEQTLGVVRIAHRRRAPTLSPTPGPHQSARGVDCGTACLESANGYDAPFARALFPRCVFGVFDGVTARAPRD